MRYRVELSSRARSELFDARDYLAEHAPEYVSTWLANMRRAVRSLRDMPERCAYAPERDLFELELRQLLEGSYRIIFTIEGQTVRVLHIRHAARQSLDPAADE